jgi:hypothetical protein
VAEKRGEAERKVEKGVGRSLWKRREKDEERVGRADQTLVKQGEKGKEK